MCVVGLWCKCKQSGYDMDVHQHRGRCNKALVITTGSCSQFYHGAATVHEYNSSVKQL